MLQVVGRVVEFVVQALPRVVMCPSCWSLPSCEHGVCRVFKHAKQMDHGSISSATAALCSCRKYGASSPVSLMLSKSCVVVLACSVACVLAQHLSVNQPVGQQQSCLSRVEALQLAAELCLGVEGAA